MIHDVYLTFVQANRLFKLERKNIELITNKLDDAVTVMKLIDVL